MSLEAEEFETSDLYLSAFLRYAGCTMRQRRQGPRMFFIFVNPAGSIKELRDAYYQGTAKVCPHQYSHLVISLKQLANGG